MPDRHSKPRAKLNSEKSSTYGSVVDQRIIEAKGGGRRRARRAVAGSGDSGRLPRPRRRGLAGQRLDNFLVKLLKGVPKTHVYRVIRSGEVRVNKGRAGADTRLALGDEVRVPPVRTSARAAGADAAPAAPPREFPVVFEDEFTCSRSTSRPASPCMAAAASASA